MALPVATLLLGAILLFFLSHFKTSRMLPGPPRKPIIGNTFEGEGQFWEKLHRYSKEFGPVFSVRILALDMVALNTIGAIREFLETNSSTYSGRRAPKMAELSGMHEGVLFQPDPTRLRQGRKFIAGGLQPGTLKAFQPVLRKHILAFLSRVLESPTGVLDAIPILPTGVAIEISYGYHATSETDPFVKRARTAMQRFTLATILSPKEGFLVNLLPMLASFPSFLPGMSWKKTATEWSAWAQASALEGLTMVKEAMANGTARPSLVQKALEANEDDLDSVLLMRTATQINSGASDTTASTLKTFILAMTLYPGAQARAQAEIDHHMANKGAGRLPDYASDRDDLPFTLSVLREVLRWNGPAPITSRNATEDGVYEGYLIKKGTSIVINMWAVMHDTNIFPDDTVFRPERWMDGKILENHDADPLDVSFGFGRRVCPGKHLAIDLVFSTIVATLAVFNIKKAKDQDGNDIIPKVEYTDRAVIAPLPFPCVVTPRSDTARQLVDNALAALG